MSDQPADQGEQAPQARCGENVQDAPAPQQTQPQETPVQNITVEQPPVPVEEPQPTAMLVARYGLMRQIGEFHHNLEKPPAPGTKVVVRTERGVELATVILPIGEMECKRCITYDRLNRFLAACGPEYPFRKEGKVLRLANSQDIIDQKHLDSSAHEETTFARQQIRELNLDMRLVKVEHLLGGERIIFYFTAETRVDFRELVRRLASQYRTRIEMRQVGARDEARIAADYERCGRRCCCQEYLKDLKPVSMRMAKTQKATLDPSKISGRCGRLMCCLRYEDETYEDLRKRLPRKNIWVRTEKLVGRVIDTQIITQLVRLLLADNTQAVVANEDIIERDVEPPPVMESPDHIRSQPERVPWQQAPVMEEAKPTPVDFDDHVEEYQKTDEPEPEPADVGQPDVQREDQPHQKRRPRRRHSKNRQQTGEQPGASRPDQRLPRGPDNQQSGQPTPAGQGSQMPGSHKRRRRRRKKKPGNPQGGTDAAGKSNPP